MENELQPIPAASGVDLLHAQVCSLLERARVFEALGLVAAKTGDGLFYSYDHATDTTVIATAGMLVKQTDATYTITLARPGAETSRVLADTAQYTQQQQGALLGHSQPWVSGQEASCKAAMGKKQRRERHEI